MPPATTRSSLARTLRADGSTRRSEPESGWSSPGVAAVGRDRRRAALDAVVGAAAVRHVELAVRAEGEPVRVVAAVREPPEHGGAALGPAVLVRVLEHLHAAPGQAGGVG